MRSTATTRRRQCKIGGNEDDGGLALRLWPQSGPRHPWNIRADYTALIGRAEPAGGRNRAADALLTDVDKFFGNPTRRQVGQNSRKKINTE